MKRELEMKNSKEGGFKATIFVFVMVGLENLGLISVMMNMVLYLLVVMHFDLSGSATTTTNFLGGAFLVSIVGAFISDTYMNRLNTILVFGAFELLGYTLLILQSHFTSLQPEPCDESKCVKGGKALMLYASLSLLGMGAGGIRGCVGALGADQFDQKDPEEGKLLSRFFNFYLLSITVGAAIGVTFVVWVSMHKGWDKGYIISVVAALVSFIIVASGKSFYRVRIPGQSAALSILEVLVVMVKNRREPLPENPNTLYEDDDQESALKEEKILHTNQFRLLDKAAILGKEVQPGKWRVCTVTQVEELKILTRMMPIIISTIFMNTCLAQLQTFTIQQGTMMNPYIGSFKVPAASIPVIPLIFMFLLIPIYEFLAVPAIRRLTGHPNGITHLQRVGVGLVLSAISMSIAGAVEVKRKHEILHHGNRISLFWLSFQYAVFGIADMFTLAGLMEFFYSEAPAGMRSLATAFSWLSLSLGYFLSTAFVEITNSVTRKVTESKRGWLEGRDMNMNHVELFYMLLAILSVLNFDNYLYWANWYTYKKEAPIMKEGKSLKPRSGEEEENMDSYITVTPK